MKISKEIKIGITALLGISLLYYGIFYLKGKNIFHPKREFIAVYDNVKGLVASNSVIINGFKIGVVKELYFIPNDTNGRIIAILSLNQDFKIPDNSIAVIESDLLGTASVHIKLGKSGTHYNYGDTLLSSVSSSLQEEVSLQMLPVKAKAENLMLSMDSLLESIRLVFNETTRENLSKSFEGIKHTIQNLENTSFSIDTLVVGQKKRLERIIGNIESISNNIKNSNEKFTNIISNFSNISDSLVKSNIVKTIANANTSLEYVADIMGKIDKGEGSLGLLINNDSLYRNLESATKELDALILDIKLHPSRYIRVSVFGGKPGKNPYKAPEKRE